MQLKDWCYQNRLTIKKLAKSLGISESGANYIYHRKRSPSLLLAVKIINFTHGEVGLVDILSRKDFESFMAGSYFNSSEFPNS